MSSDVTKAMILAAGEGTRLRPLTSETPKVLLPVSGRPLIEHQLSWLKNHGIREVAINLYHLGDNIKDFLGDGSSFGMEIVYSTEETLLGTAGGVKKLEDFFSDTFIVIYGDILTDFNLSEMIAFHKERKAMVTIALMEVVNTWEVGIVETNEQGEIMSFVEKPPRGSNKGNLASGGIYVLKKEIFDYIPSQGSCDFGYNIFPQLLELDISLYGYIMKPEDYIIDIGTTDKYRKANEDVQAGRVKINHG